MSSWQILIGAKADIVERTASKELALFFEDFLRQRAVVRAETPGSSEGNCIRLGTVMSSAAVKSAHDNGVFRRLDPQGTTDDAFEIAVKGDAIYIAGQNPRGVLYGAYCLDEYVRRNGKRFPPDGWRIYRRPAFRERLTVSYNSLAHVFNEEDVRYMSRLGYNQMSVTVWGMPLGGFGIAPWTDSGVFPSIKEPKHIATVKNFLKAAKRYGIEGVFYFTEPQPILGQYGQAAVERLGGKDLLGYRPVHGGLRTTCTSHPTIQEHYRSMIANLAKDFPEICKVIVYEDDGSFWFCHPDHCARCRASLKKQKPPYTAHSWELTSSFINLLQDAGRQVRPDFQAAGACFHYRDVMEQYMENLNKGAGAIAAIHNSDGWIYISITNAMRDRLRRIASAANANSTAFGIVDEFTQSEKFGFAPACPWPHATYGKLHAYAQVGVRNFFEECAPIPIAQSINPLVLRECLWDPKQDKSALLHRIATEQFGLKAGEKMQLAWLEMKSTFETYARPGTVWWSTYLMTGNLASQFGMFRPLTITGLKANPDQYYSGGPSPTSHAHFRKEYRNEKSLAQLEEACGHIRKAVAYAKEAVELAPTDRTPFYSFYYFPRRDISCREYAEEQYHSLNFNRYIFESNANFIKAELLVREDKLDAARSVIARENAMTEEILRTSAAYLSRKIGLLHDCAARVTPYAVLNDRHPVIDKLKRKLAPVGKLKARKITVPMQDTPARIDGVLDDEVWKRAAETGEFFRHTTTRQADVQTTVRIYRDARNLYLAFDCSEPHMDQIVAAHRERDSAVYRDDCVNIFLDPSRGEDKPYHFIVNALGAQYDEKGDDPGWDGEWEAAAAKSDTAWTVEIRIPFKTLRVVPEKGDVWACNFNRERQTRGKELSSWSPTMDVFADPQRFGELLFQ